VNYGVECLNGFNMDVWCILLSLVNYGKTHLGPREVVWITYANKGIMESF